VLRFKLESSLEIIEGIKAQLAKEGRAVFEVLSPDCGKFYSGSKVAIEGERYIYRSLKSWIDLANTLHCKMLIPKPLNDTIVQMTFEQCSSHHSFHHTQDSTEKYGTQSEFALIDKSNEFAFAYYYLQALAMLNFDSIERVINLGINRGDEFATLQELLSPQQFNAIEWVGVDYAPSTIEYAKNRFKAHSNMHFFAHDINTLSKLQLGRFDLLITIATLQSVNSNFKKLFMDLVQQLLHTKSSIVMGFPNSRWVDGELIYGAKVPHYNHSELSTLIKDIYFCKKYLQQHNYRVRIFGKEYLFLVATKI